jgi:hypothetical protein
MNVKVGWMERRLFERVDASVRVSYRRVPKSELVKLLMDPSYRDTTSDRLPELAKSSTVVSAVTKDLSVGGMSLTGPEEFPLGDAVAVFLYLPDAPAPVTVVAEVVRSQKSGGTGEGAFRAGLKILAVNREDVVRIEKYLLAQRLRSSDGGPSPGPGKKR